MNRKEIKSFLPILQAFADGKEIESREEDEWYRVLEICNETNPQDYRIKPEPTYRPFKNAEECLTEMLKHQPLGWIKTKKVILISFMLMTFMQALAIRMVAPSCWLQKIAIKTPPSSTEHLSVLNWRNSLCLDIVNFAN